MTLSSEAGSCLFLHGPNEAFLSLIRFSEAVVWPCHDRKYLFLFYIEELLLSFPKQEKYFRTQIWGISSLQNHRGHLMHFSDPEPVVGSAALWFLCLSKHTISSCTNYLWYVWIFFFYEKNIEARILGQVTNRGLNWLHSVKFCSSNNLFMALWNIRNL